MRLLTPPNQSFFSSACEGLVRARGAKSAFPDAPRFDLLDGAVFQSYLAARLLGRELSAILTGLGGRSTKCSDCQPLLNEVHRFIEYAVCALSFWKRVPVNSSRRARTCWLDGPPAPGDVPARAKGRPNATSIWPGFCDGRYASGLARPGLRGGLRVKGTPASETLLGGSWRGAGRATRPARTNSGRTRRALRRMGGHTAPHLETRDHGLGARYDDLPTGHRRALEPSRWIFVIRRGVGIAIGAAAAKPMLHAHDLKRCGPPEPPGLTRVVVVFMGERPFRTNDGIEAPPVRHFLNELEHGTRVDGLSPTKSSRNWFQTPLCTACPRRAPGRHHRDPFDRMPSGARGETNRKWGVTEHWLPLTQLTISTHQSTMQRMITESRARSQATGSTRVPHRHDHRPSPVR